MKTLEYLKARFAEKSTWASIGAAIIVAAAVPSPYSYFSIVVAVIGTLVPTTKTADT